MRGGDLAGQLPNPAAVASPSFRLVVEHVEVLRRQVGGGGDGGGGAECAGTFR